MGLIHPSTPPSLMDHTIACTHLARIERRIASVNKGLTVGDCKFNVTAGGGIGCAVVGLQDGGLHAIDVAAVGIDDKEVPRGRLQPGRRDFTEYCVGGPAGGANTGDLTPGVASLHLGGGRVGPVRRRGGGEIERGDEGARATQAPIFNIPRGVQAPLVVHLPPRQRGERRGRGDDAGLAVHRLGQVVRGVDELRQDLKKPAGAVLHENKERVATARARQVHSGARGQEPSAPRQVLGHRGDAARRVAGLGQDRVLIVQPGQRAVEQDLAHGEGGDGQLGLGVLADDGAADDACGRAGLVAGQRRAHGDARARGLRGRAALGGGVEV